ncbi:hypothetical protein ACFL3B_02200, partial [Gemmatimonadota bacterium]
VMPIIFVQIAVGGFIETIPKTKAGLDGLLFATHLWLSVPLTLMILCQYAKVFINNRVEEPLVAHPSLYLGLARHRTLASIPFVALAFTGMFFAYFWQPLAARLNHLWIAIPIHMLSTGLLVFAAAIIVGAIGRKLLRGATRRGIRNPDLFVNLTGGIAMTVFAALLLGIILVNKFAVGVFEALGNSLAVSFPVGMIPFAAALAADEGRRVALTGWLGLSTGLALWSLRATYRWSFSAHREIPIDLATPVHRLFTPVFTGLPSRWLPPGISAFWRKDIVVPYSREPKRYLFHQVNLLWWGIMSVILTMALRKRGIISAAFADTVPVLMTLAAMAVLAMQNGVNALGREGKEITWLRPFVTGSQLFGRKLLVNCTYVLVHGIAFAFIVSTASHAASLNTSIWILISYAVGAGGVFACMATSVGFLLPDFERKRSSLPGSTTLGRFGFLFCAVAVVGITGVAHLLLTAAVIDGGFYAGMLTFALVCAAMGTILIAAAAIRQYRGMEI